MSRSSSGCPSESVVWKIINDDFRLAGEIGSPPSVTHDDPEKNAI
jgi:hypothetical protein